MRYLICLLLVVLHTVPIFADQPAAVPGSPVTVTVWPGLAPGETTINPGVISSPKGDPFIQVTDVTAPQLLIFRPDNLPNHPALLVFPGGGYSILSEVSEGTEIAQWLNRLGYAAAVLLYRVPGNRIGAFQDAQRAMSVVRSRAAELGIDPAKLGVIGFSAGGHLAARLSCNSDTRTYAAIDSVDAVNCRPDFTVLIYPAYLVDKTSGAIAPEVAPHAGMPPIFLAQTFQDPYFDILPYAAALQTQNVPVECLAYAGGGHGYGLHAPVDAPVSNWPVEAAAWLKTQTAATQN